MAEERGDGWFAHLYSVLGMVAISNRDEVVALPSSKPATLLTAMLLHPNEVVSTDYLQRAVWGEDLPDSARSTLHTYVLRLRRLFAKFGISNDSIVTKPGGYSIPVTEDTLDLLRFRNLTRAAETAADAEVELRLLREALLLWQGAPLSNIQSDLLHRDEVPRLVEEWLRTSERRFEVALSLGRCREILADLRAAARTYPGHERFAELLVRALHRAGRSAEALDECRRVREFLREQLGVEPGSTLRGLELAILRGEEPKDASTARPRAVVLPGHPMPGDLPDFTGRRPEIDALLARLAAPRPGPAVAVVSGAPGIGKTTLAVHVAHLVREHFPDGIRFVAATDLGSLRTPVDGTALLVIDDVTEIGQVLPVLPLRPDAAALVTSRHSLTGLAERRAASITRLGPLQPDESLKLLAAIIGTARCDAEPDAAADLATRCGHVPLALRIAATRLVLRPVLRIANQVARLRDDVTGRLARSGTPELSLAGMFERHLDEVDSATVAALVTLGGHATGQVSLTEYAELLGEPPETTIALADRLIDANLLDDDGAGGYQVPHLLREFLRVHHRAGTPSPSRRDLP